MVEARRSIVQIKIVGKLNSILQVLKIDADSGTLCRFDTVKFKRL